MADLTQDEFTILLLAEHGESMIPIGRWKEAILALAERGLMQRNDEVNYGITLAGREACAERNREDDAALRPLLERSNKLANVQTQAQQSVEQAAQCLATAAKASALATGDDLVYALRQWSEHALKRALELLK